MEERKLKISFFKGGSGSYSTRMILPKLWIDQLKFNEENREARVYFTGSEIVITNLENKEDIKSNKEERILKVAFNKSKRGSISPRISIPISWVHDLGITKEDNLVNVAIDNNLENLIITT